jgi:hypothetical protein
MYYFQCCPFISVSTSRPELLDTDRDMIGMLRHNRIYALNMKRSRDYLNS